MNAAWALCRVGVLCRLVSVTTLLAANICVATVTTLEPARDLAADARVAAARMQPIVIMVSLAGCPYCEIVRRSHLLPILNESKSGNIPLIRQVELNGAALLTDFAGNRVSHGAFAAKLKAKIAPVVYFFAPDGSQLVEPLVGAMIPDFYGAYFAAALADAITRMREPLADKFAPR